MLRASVLVVALCAGAPWSALGAARPFTGGLLGGTAIAGFQSDMGVGAPNDPGSDWWVWVRDPQNVSAGRVSGDLPETGPGFWLLYRKDALRVRRRLGGNAFRMGI